MIDVSVVRAVSDLAVREQVLAGAVDAVREVCKHDWIAPQQDALGGAGTASISGQVLVVLVEDVLAALDGKRP